jgi:FkbM family methyltransferase
MADRRLINQALRDPRMWPSAALFLLKKKLGQERITVRRQNVTLCVGARGGQGAWQAISGLDYEPELRQLLARVQPGNVVLDIGANIGSYTLRCAQKVGPAGRVISFEAVPENACLLQNNIELNGLSNVTIVPRAAGAGAGRVALFSTGHASSTRLAEGGNFNRVGEIEMVTADSVVEELGLPCVDWIKMDIEGGEPDALRGLEQTVARWRPNILFENGAKGKETIALLQERKYRVGIYDSRGEFTESARRENLFAYPSERPLPVAA